MTPESLADAIPSAQQSITRLRQTRSGVLFDSAADYWLYRDGVSLVSLRFQTLEGASISLRETAKNVLAWYAENSAPAHLRNMFYLFKHFLGSVDCDCINCIRAEQILSYRSILGRTREWYLSALSGFFDRWHRLGYQGLDEDVPLLLKQLRLKGNAKGRAVLTMDVNDGPFTQIEAEAIQSAINSAYADRRIDMSQFVLVWLFILLGQRLSQYAALKVCDVRVGKDRDGIVKYSIWVPSAKKRTMNSRDSGVERPLIEQFGEVLVAYAEGIKKRYAGLLPDSSQLPLFITLKSNIKAPPGFEFHWTANDIGKMLAVTFEHLSVLSERTGRLMKIRSTRFRRTIGSRAAEEGHGPLVIAQLLDHTDTQNVGVYTANSSAIIDRIDRAIAMEMAPLAQAFEGMLEQEENVRGTDPRKRIIDLRIDRSGQSMGKCGQSGVCGFCAPIACYTCRNFVAWVDGPHEAVLDYLLLRREQLLRTSDKRMASVNDRTILAVAAVVMKCCQRTAPLALGVKSV